MEGVNIKMDEPEGFGAPRRAAFISLLPKSRVSINFSVYNAVNLTSPLSRDTTFEARACEKKIFLTVENHIRS